jgi:hypothetical protein
MDAYNIYHLLKKLWAEHTNKNSGIIDKSGGDIKVCVWTAEGYREVIGLRYNESLKFIELELDVE